MWLYDLQYYTENRSRELRPPITISFELSLIFDRQISHINNKAKMEFLNKSTSQQILERVILSSFLYPLNTQFIFYKKLIDFRLTWLKPIKNEYSMQISWKRKNP